MLDILNFAIFYTAVFLTLRKLIPIPPKLDEITVLNIYSYSTALVHSSLSLVLSLSDLISTSGVHYDQPISSFQCTVISVIYTQNTLGFLLMDYIVSSYYGIIDLKMKIHHICGGIGGLALLLDPYAGSAAMGNSYTAVILITENTSPLFQIKHLLMFYKKTETKVYLVNGLCFCGMFLLCRPVLAWVIMFNFWAGQFSWIVKFNAVAVYCLGLYWSYEILCLLKKKFAGKKEYGKLDRLKDKKIGWAFFLAFVAVVVPNFMIHFLEVKDVHLSLGQFRLV